MHNTERGEILSPAGNIDMLYAAVRSGADAVYLGAKEFSARRNAENFTEDELAVAVRYCHIHGVSVYLTLNTVIKNSELSAALAVARNAYNCGVDGIIIQDLGLAAILHKKIPELKLHASTQMSVHSPSALPILKKLGFKQVVLAREMSREEIKEVCQRARELGITVEVFVHGALCMCVSGQCLLSAFLGSRSGNRGLCAGPCRLPFKAEGGTGYDLSLKDLSLLKYIRELYSLGVRSFKIEGRMKRPEYVAAATATCKQALEKGSVDETLSDTLKNVFSRSGFTDGYYTSQLGPSMFGIRTREDVISAEDAFPLLHGLYRNEPDSVPVSLNAVIEAGKPISLTVSDNAGNTAYAEGAVPSVAQSRPLTYEAAYKSLSKLGGTPYYDIGGGIRLQDGLFVSAGELNSLRRKAIELLDEKRSELRLEKSTAEYTPNKAVEKKSRKAPEIYVRLENAEQLSETVATADAVILPAEKNPEPLLSRGLRVIAELPRGITSESALTSRLKYLSSLGITEATCGNLAAIEIAQKCGFEILGDLGLNLANSESFNLLKELGVKAALVSCEATFKEISEITSPIPLGITVYGNLPLMLFRNCPLKNGRSCDSCDKKGFLTDRLGTEFPVSCKGGYSELFNSVPLWLADRPDDIKNADFKVLYFTRESAERVSEVIAAYKSCLPPDTKHTRGLYFRGTL